MASPISQDHETNVQARARFYRFRKHAIAAEFIRLPAKCQRVVPSWRSRDGFWGGPMPVDVFAEAIC
jgi:hypothetical protein